MTDTAAAIQQAVVIRPGDHLVVRVERDTTRDEADQIKAELRERIPDLGGVTVVAAEGLYVFRGWGSDG